MKTPLEQAQFDRAQLQPILLPSPQMLNDLKAWVRQHRWFPEHTGDFHLVRWQPHTEVCTNELDCVDPDRVDLDWVDLDWVDAVWLVDDTTLVSSPVIIAGEAQFVDAFTDDRFCRNLLGRMSWFGPRPSAATITRLGVEQSNSTMVVDGDVAVKLLRTTGAGQHPEIVVGHALRDAPELTPALRGQWIDQAGWARVVAHTWHAGAVDGWAVFTDPNTSHTDRVRYASELGQLTASVHAALASTMPTTPGIPSAYDDVRQQVSALLASAPEWAANKAQDGEPDLPRLLAEVAAWTATIQPKQRTLQRVHGDYHLGQVLRTADGTWRAIDFEGEPLRSNHDRHRPDHPERDVAGMLRSFAYAAAVSDPKWTPQQLDEVRRAFLAHSKRDSVSPGILWVYEVAKTCYEVRYELAHRPDWVHVPRTGLLSLLDRPDAPARSDHHTPHQPESDSMTASTHGARSFGLPQQPTGSAPTPDVSVAAAPTPVDPQVLNQLSQGLYHAPHDVLGGHVVDGHLTVRTRRPLAARVELVLDDQNCVPMTHEAEGIWATTLTASEVPAYRIRAAYDDGTVVETDDPYRHLPTLGEMDQHLIGEGRHERLWQALGARPMEFTDHLGPVHGVAFTVWAPNAQSVQVVGQFNNWDGAGHAMRSLGSTGVWEIFIPGVAVGDCYKYRIQSRHGEWREKADPMARWSESAPATASRVHTSSYQWSDQEWLERRSERNAFDAPMSIYEVHLPSWRPGLSYRELAEQLPEYVAEHGFTHVELMPIAQHPFGGSWGYQVTSYYAPLADLGTPDDFKALVDALHAKGIGVIVDWVPAHFPKDDWALARFDGECLYEHADWRQGEHPDWGTLVFNFGRNEVRNFLVANALYWLLEYHIDGLRVDAVASMLYLDYSRNDGEWIPNQFGGRENLEAISFLQETNAVCYREAPGIVMIAEESTAWPGVTVPTDHDGLGFGFKWNMGWMHDTLRYISNEPVHRQYHHHDATFSLVYAWSEKYILPISHDEVVHGKGTLMTRVPGDGWQKFATVRAYLAFMWAHPGKQMLFMGQEFAQYNEWNEVDGVDWASLGNPMHAGVSQLVRDLNSTYVDRPALWRIDSQPEGFQWIDSNDSAHNVLSFIRRDETGRELIAVVNFAGAPHYGYRLGLPGEGVWREVLNTDAHEYGGSGVGNGGYVTAYWDDQHWMPASAVIDVPPLATLWLERA